MKAYQERVVAEKKELDDKLDRLRAFIAGDMFAGLPEVARSSSWTAEQRRLRRQEAIMGLYSDVLDERIQAFS